MNNNDISMPVVKASVAIATATGAQLIDAGSQAAPFFADLLVLTWPNIAAAAAALFSMSMLCEWWWKKFWRPLFERWKWIKPIKRRVISIEEYEQVESDKVPLSQLRGKK